MTFEEMAKGIYDQDEFSHMSPKDFFVGHEELKIHLRKFGTVSWNRFWYMFREGNERILKIEKLFNIPKGHCSKLMRATSMLVQEVQTEQEVRKKLANIFEKNFLIPAPTKRDQYPEQVWAIFAFSHLCAAILLDQMKKEIKV